MNVKLKNKIVTITAVCLVLITSMACLFFPKNDYSYSERRNLAKFPQVHVSNIFSGRFMTDFENFSLDQFPLREVMRKIKALTDKYIFNRTDIGGIYEVDGYISKIQYPLNEKSVENAGDRFEYVYNKYLKDSQTKNYLAVIPDKNLFLAGEDYLRIDHKELVSLIKSETEFLNYIEISQTLSKDSYYKTDTHWRQEKIITTAQSLANAMGVQLKGEYEENTLENEFLGVYAGQYALNTEGDELVYLTNEGLDNVKVFDYQNNAEISVYDMKKAQGKDPYEMFLGGSLSLISIENQSASTDKELVIFRDSFGSSIAPLLCEAYSKITLVDIRYIHPDMLEKYIEFTNQDVLFLYSAMVLNSSETIK